MRPSAFPYNRAGRHVYVLLWQDTSDTSPRYGSDAWGSSLALGLTAAAGETLSPPSATTAPAGVLRGYAGSEANPQTTGFHKLVYESTEYGKTRQFPFSVFLPHGYAQDSKRWPMLTFLAGLGDRGSDPGMAMACGVPLEIGRSMELRQWMPMIVLTPQCPNDRVWEDAAIVAGSPSPDRCGGRPLRGSIARVYM